MPQSEFDTWSPLERAEYLLRGKTAAIQLLRDDRDRLKACRAENVQLRAKLVALSNLTSSMEMLLQLVAGCPRCASCRQTVVEFLAEHLPAHRQAIELVVTGAVANHRSPTDAER